MSNILVIPIFVPHMGCPHTCVFCNQKKIAGSFSEPTIESIEELVNSYRRTFPNINNVFVELAFYGGSFTGIRLDLQEKLLKIAYKLKKETLINGIRLSTRPDYINKQIVNRLLRYGVTTVELGVQSMDEDVLRASQRGHSVEQVEEAVKLLKLSGINVGIQLMPGLPEDTKEKVLRTTFNVIKFKPDFVRIYPTLVIKETELETEYLKGLFVPWTLEETINVVAIMAIYFAKADIPIIRMGLQATDNLTLGKDLVAGPNHPAFGELVKSRIFRKQIEYLLLQNSFLDNGGSLTLYCHPNESSQVKGQKQTNILYFHEKNKIKLEVIPKGDLEQGSLAWVENNVNKVFSRRNFLDNYRINS